MSIQLLLIILGSAALVTIGFLFAFGVIKIPSTIAPVTTTMAPVTTTMKPVTTTMTPVTTTMKPVTTTMTPVTVIPTTTTIIPKTLRTYIFSAGNGGSITTIYNPGGRLWGGGGAGGRCIRGVCGV